MTTSFAHFVRGELLASLYVQPMGFLLATSAAIVFWASAYIAWTGRPVHRLLKRLPALPIILTLAGFAIVAWGWKMFIHTRDIDGWR